MYTSNIKTSTSILQTAESKARRYSGLQKLKSDKNMKSAKPSTKMSTELPTSKSEEKIKSSETMTRNYTDKLCQKKKGVAMPLQPSLRNSTFLIDKKNGCFNSIQEDDSGSIYIAYFIS